jgi:hypothetical protein
MAAGLQRQALPRGPLPVAVAPEALAVRRRLPRELVSRAGISTTIQLSGRE